MQFSCLLLLVFSFVFIVCGCFAFDCVLLLSAGWTHFDLCRLVVSRLGVQSGSYIHMGKLRQLDHPPSTGSSTVRLPDYLSPIRLPILARLLRSHPDQEFVSFIVNGLADGFHVGFSPGSPLAPSSTRNHPSSRANCQIISSYIREEVSLGRMVGPIPEDVALSWGVHCSPIGLIPKSQPGQWRMIVDLSFPRGVSVNDGISSSCCSVVYTSVDDAVQFLRQLGPHALMVKVDLKSAYRIVPIHPRDRFLLGVQWEGEAYIDQALPFGLCSAPILFTAVADAIGWALYQAGFHFLIHYLDDYLFFFHPACLPVYGPFILSHILGVLAHLGVLVAHHKIEGPATIVTFLGVEIDSVRLELRLPLSKLTRVRRLLTTWHARRSGPLSEFESLVGHLSHVATVLRQGRVFLRHSYIALASARSRQQFVHINEIIRADLLWWEYFLQHWNGRMFFRRRDPSFHVFTDASGSYGCGGYFAPNWFSLQWPSSWADSTISVKELVPVVLAAALWGMHWRGLNVCFHSDNSAVVAMLSKWSAGPLSAHHLVRCLYFYSAFYRFDFAAEHISGVSNVVADALSRNNVHLFPSLLSQAYRSRIPLPILDLLIYRQPHWGSNDWIRLFVATLRAL